MPPPFAQWPYTTDIPRERSPWAAQMSQVRLFRHWQCYECWLRWSSSTRDNHWSMNVRHYRRLDTSRQLRIEQDWVWRGMKFWQGQKRRGLGGFAAFKDPRARKIPSDSSSLQVGISVITWFSTWPTTELLVPPSAPRFTRIYTATTNRKRCLGYICWGSKTQVALPNSSCFVGANQQA